MWKGLLKAKMLFINLSKENITVQSCFENTLAFKCVHIVLHAFTCSAMFVATSIIL